MDAGSGRFCESQFSNMIQKVDSRSSPELWWVAVWMLMMKNAQSFSSLIPRSLYLVWSFTQPWYSEVPWPPALHWWFRQAKPGWAKPLGEWLRWLFTSGIRHPTWHPAGAAWPEPSGPDVVPSTGALAVLTHRAPQVPGSTCMICEGCCKCLPILWSQYISMYHDEESWLNKICILYIFMYTYIYRIIYQCMYDDMMTYFNKFQ